VANATIIYSPFSQTIDFVSTSYTIDLPGIAFLKLGAQAGTNSHRILAYGAGDTNMMVAVQGGTTVAALRAASGLKWNSGGGFFGSLTFANIVRTNGTKLIGPGEFADKYLLFTFKNSDAANQVQYGWVGMSAATVTPGTFANMSVTFTNWAYDDTGAKIAAGAVPEPATAASLAMGGALVLGAAGLRQWRKRKVTTAKSVSDLIA
jgi:hypothetical protein